MIPMIIGGEQYRPKDGSIISVLNPSSGEVMDELGCARLEDVDQAFKMAKDQQITWMKTSADQREKIFHRAATLLEQNLDSLSNLIMNESGSTLAKSKHEVSYGAQILRASAGEARRLYGDTVPDDKDNRMSLVTVDPLGVVAVISPFNAPLALLIKMMAFPLAAGNSLVVKPSEETPAIAAKFVELLHEAGLEPGIVNLLQGGGDVGQMMVDHSNLDGLTFTGSTAVGQKIGASLGRRLKGLHLELGGNNPLIICDDFSIEEAVDQSIFGSFFHGGQICMASSRILIQDKIYEDFKDMFLAKVSNLEIGALDSDSTFYGPLINERAIQGAMSTVNKELEDGAKSLSGPLQCDGLRMKPCILTDLPTDSKVWHTETFAPVINIRSFSSDEEALKLANDSLYGLSAGILSNNYRRALPLAKGIRCGGVHIGSHPFQSGSMTPVGGMGLSGIGKSGGKYSIEHFTEKKWLSFNL